MTYEDFLETVIERGIAAAAESYADDRPKRDGAIDGFKACRGLQPREIGALLTSARRYADELARPLRKNVEALVDNSQYWYARCYALEIEWVANCVSAMLQNQGLPVIVTPTARGVMNAAAILGVEGSVDGSAP